MKRKKQNKNQRKQTEIIIRRAEDILPILFESRFVYFGEREPETTVKPVEVEQGSEKLEYSDEVKKGEEQAAKNIDKKRDVFQELWEITKEHPVVIGSAAAALFLSLRMFWKKDALSFAGVAATVAYTGLTIGRQFKWSWANKVWDKITAKVPALADVDDKIRNLLKMETRTIEALPESGRISMEKMMTVYRLQSLCSTDWDTSEGSRNAAEYSQAANDLITDFKNKTGYSLFKGNFDIKNADHRKQLADELRNMVSKIDIPKELAAKYPGMQNFFDVIKERNSVTMSYNREKDINQPCEGEKSSIKEVIDRRHGRTNDLLNQANNKFNEILGGATQQLRNMSADFEGKKMTIHQNMKKLKDRMKLTGQDTGAIDKQYAHIQTVFNGYGANIQSTLMKFSNANSNVMLDKLQSRLTTLHTRITTNPKPKLEEINAFYDINLALEANMMDIDREMRDNKDSVWGYVMVGGLLLAGGFPLFKLGLIGLGVTFSLTKGVAGGLVNLAKLNVKGAAKAVEQGAGKFLRMRTMLIAYGFIQSLYFASAFAMDITKIRSQYERGELTWQKLLIAGVDLAAMTASFVLTGFIATAGKKATGRITVATIGLVAVAVAAEATRQALQYKDIKDNPRTYENKPLGELYLIYASICHKTVLNHVNFQENAAPKARKKILEFIYRRKFAQMNYSEKKANEMAGIAVSRLWQKKGPPAQEEMILAVPKGASLEQFMNSMWKDTKNCAKMVKEMWTGTKDIAGKRKKRKEFEKHFGTPVGQVDRGLMEGMRYAMMEIEMREYEKRSQAGTYPHLSQEEKEIQIAVDAQIANLAQRHREAKERNEQKEISKILREYKEIINGRNEAMKNYQRDLLHKESVKNDPGFVIAFTRMNRESQENFVKSCYLVLNKYPNDQTVLKRLTLARLIVNLDYIAGKKQSTAFDAATITLKYSQNKIPELKEEIRALTVKENSPELLALKLKQLFFLKKKTKVKELEKKDFKEFCKKTGLNKDSSFLKNTEYFTDEDATTLYRKKDDKTEVFVSFRWNKPPSALKTPENLAQKTWQKNEKTGIYYMKDHQKFIYNYNPLQNSYFLGTLPVAPYDLPHEIATGSKPWIKELSAKL